MKLAIVLAIVLLAYPAQARSDRLDAATTAVLVAVPVGLLVWDGYLALHDSHTESQLVAKAAWKANAIPYAIGALAGHWFAPQGQGTQRRWMIGLGSVAAVAVVDIVAGHAGVGKAAWRYPAIWFGMGFGVGVLTLAQEW